MNQHDQHRASELRFLLALSGQELEKLRKNSSDAQKDHIDSVLKAYHSEIKKETYAMLKTEDALHEDGFWKESKKVLKICRRKEERMKTETGVTIAIWLSVFSLVCSLAVLALIVLF